MITEQQYSTAKQIVQQYKEQQFQPIGQFEIIKGIVHCKCGKKAVDLRNNGVYLCRGITVPHGCTYKKPIEKIIEHPCICDEIRNANKDPNTIATGFCMKHKTSWL